MTDERKWCNLCGNYVYPEDEVESECCYLDCPMSRPSDITDPPPSISVACAIARR